MLVVISITLVAATIIVPLRPTVKEAGWQLVVGGTGYFALIGVGFMMIEIALLQRMSVFLGHPVYALSVVLFSLILWTGFGSMASERVRLDGAGKLVAWSVASAAYLFALPFWLPIVFGLDGADLVVRAGLCVLVLAPAGFLMGFGFPTGMRLVSTINAGPMPWFWGINGGAGVLAASIAVVTSIAFSIDTTLRTELSATFWSPLQPYCWCSLVRDPTTPHHDPCTHTKARMCRMKIGRFTWVILRSGSGLSRSGESAALDLDFQRCRPCECRDRNLRFTLPSWTAARGQRASPRLLRSRAPATRRFDR
jgi:hypothetical protein